MSEIEQIKPALSVILDADSHDAVVQSIGPVAKQMLSAILPLLSSSPRVTVISDGDMKVFRNKNGAPGKSVPLPPPTPPSEPAQETPASPFPKSARERIQQDSAAPPAPELADEYMEELRKQQQEESQLREQQKFNSQDALPQEEEPSEPAPSVRRRKERNLAIANSVCGRCGGGGQVMGEAGFEGMCPVCSGSGQAKSWGRRAPRSSAR